MLKRVARKYARLGGVRLGTIRSFREPLRVRTRIDRTRHREAAAFRITNQAVVRNLGSAVGIRVPVELERMFRPVSPTNIATSIPEGDRGLS